MTEQRLEHCYQRPPRLCFAAAPALVVAAAAIVAVAGNSIAVEDTGPIQNVPVEPSIAVVAGGTLCWLVFLEVGRNYRSLGVGSAGSSEVQWGIEGWGRINPEWMHCLELQSPNYSDWRTVMVENLQFPSPLCCSFQFNC